MKKILKLILIIGLLCAAVSCHRYSEEILLTSKPIELSQDQVHFREGGGEVTINCLNYHWWSIAALLELGQNGADDVYLPVSNNENSILQEAIGEGIKVTVDDDPRQLDDNSSVKIIVDPCATHRSWKLRMNCGNLFTTIRISQN